MAMEADVSVVILAAGLGTRMKSPVAKVLHRAGGAPLIEHVVRVALKVAPPERVVVVTGHQAGQVEAAVSRHGVRFRRQEEQKGTGHAVRVCRQQPGLESGLLVVLYGDCPLLRTETVEALADSGADFAFVTPAISLQAQ